MSIASPAAAKRRTDLLEQQLLQQEDAMQRIALLDQLLPDYIYTRPERSRQLLDELDALLGDKGLNDVEDFLFRSLIYRSTLENQTYHHERAVVIQRKLLLLAEERGDVSQLAEIYMDACGTYVNINQLETAEDHLDRAEALLRNYPDPILLARATFRRGYIYLHRNSYGRAIDNLLKAATIYEESTNDLTVKDHYFLTLIHAGLGRIYERNDDRQRCIQAYQAVVKRCEKWNLRSRLAWHYLHLGNALMNANYTAQAVRYFKLALIAESDGSEVARAGAYANLGNIFVEQGSFGEAEELLQRAWEIYDRLPEPDYVNSSLISFSRAQIKAATGNPREALTELATAFSLAEQADDYQQLADISLQQAKLHAELGDYQSAYHIQQGYNNFQELHLQQMNRRKQAEIEARYQTEAKEREAERLSLEAGKLQLKALRAQMNPHFLYNALNSIQSFITGNDLSTASRYLARFAKLMRKSLEYSDVEYISLEEERAFLDDYLTINQALRFGGEMTYTIIIDEDLEEDILGVPTMILQPYVENAIEHGLRSRKGGHIEVRFDLVEDNDDELLASVTDNGIGRAASQEIQQRDPRYNDHRSRGTEITERRLRLLCGDATFSDPDADDGSDDERESPVRTIDLFGSDGQTPAGTRVEVVIPIVDLHLR